MSEDQLRALISLEFKASLVDYARQAIIATTIDGRILYWNAHATRVYGWKADEVIGRSIVDVIVPVIQREQAAEIMAKLGAGETWQGEFEVQRKDGDSFLAHVIDAPLLDERGELVGIIGISEEVSERVRLEHDTGSASERVQRSLRTEAIGRLVGGVAHDINNLLMAIMNYASLIRDKDGLPPSAVSHAATIHSLCVRGRQLSRNLLGFAENPGGPDVEDIDVRELVGRTMELLARTVPKSIRLREAFEPGSMTWRGDRAQLSQLIINLAVNAIDALANHGGELELRAVRESVGDGAEGVLGTLSAGDYIRLDVIDDGPGMDEATQARSLEPFFTTKGSGQALGLGLSLAYNTARDHRGALVIDSTEGQGTTVSVWIPAVVVPALQIMPERASSPGKKLAGATILLIDDEPVVRAACELVLESLGHNVLIARDGREGVEQFREHAADIDLVLLDMVMPVMDGREAFHAMQAIDAKVPIMLATGQSKKGIVELFEAGARGLLEKPYDGVELQRVLAEILE